MNEMWRKRKVFQIERARDQEIERVREKYI